MVSLDKNKLTELLKSLKDFPQLKEIRALRKRLKKEEEKVISKQVIKTVPIKEEVQVIGNEKRSRKLQRYWRYVKLIRDNFPDLSVSQIRKQLTQRQLGNEVDIPDAVWQNPSA